MFIFEKSLFNWFWHDQNNAHDFQFYPFANRANHSIKFSLAASGNNDACMLSKAQNIISKDEVGWGKKSANGFSK